MTPFLSKEMTENHQLSPRDQFIVTRYWLTKMEIVVLRPK